MIISALKETLFKKRENLNNSSSFRLVNLHNKFMEATKRFGLDKNKRMSMYRSLERMTADPASLQINDAIKELQKLQEVKGYRNREWYIYQDILEQLSDRDNFGTAIARYIPQQDSIIISAAEQEDITIGFTSVIAMNKKTQLMKKAYVSAITYPVILLVLLLVIIYYFASIVVPQMTSTMTSSSKLSGISSLLVAFTNSFSYWFPVLCISVISLIGFIIWAIPNLTGTKRKYIENFPPFNMYKIVVGCGFLYSLNSLSQAGYMHIEALDKMVDGVNKYLRSRILVLMDLLADGMDVGQALIASKMDFPDKKMLTELAIQIEYSDSEDGLEMLANTLAEDGLETIQRQARILNTCCTILIASIVAFLYMGIYSLGSDISNI